MLKHLAPAILVTALLAGATVVFAADTTPTTQIASAVATDTTDVTPTPRIKKTKLHHLAKKSSKATNVSAKKKAGSSSQASRDEASRPETN